MNRRIAAILWTVLIAGTAAIVGAGFAFCACSNSEAKPAPAAAPENKPVAAAKPSEPTPAPAKKAEPAPPENLAAFDCTGGAFRLAEVESTHEGMKGRHTVPQYCLKGLWKTDKSEQGHWRNEYLPLTTPDALETRLAQLREPRPVVAKPAAKKVAKPCPPCDTANAAAAPAASAAKPAPARAAAPAETDLAPPPPGGGEATVIQAE
ncbi:hypothetical protein HYW17_01505 [Candidatus Uhrbacteria bacterium]|nr:hypothetical protein [Candidatus Uhrbacteria bacterium]